MPRILLRDAIARGYGEIDWHTDADGNIVSREGYGKYEHSVITDDEGNMLYDCLINSQRPGVFVWVFCEVDGVCKSLLIKERRDSAAPADGHSTRYFWNIARGFIDEGENAEVAGRRESDEEAGVGKVMKTWQLPGLITNEALTTYASPLLVMQVAPDSLGQMHNEGGEEIAGRQFFTDNEINQMLTSGEYDGALCNSLILAGSYQIFRLHRELGTFL